MRRRNPSAPKRREKYAHLALASVKENGVTFRTGQSVTFLYARNTAKAPRVAGNRFGQDIEPAGRYLLATDGGPVPHGWVTGELTFRSPLVLWRSTDDDYMSEGGWKRRLSREYGGKKKLALSRAILRDGHDGIVTVDVMRREGHPPYYFTSEIVDLSVIAPIASPSRRRMPPTAKRRKGR